ncbi:IS110 family transposase [Sporosarcina sp. FSL W8-0480]|uniref:IS110 family transposase n=1 Tax=Sporosarcina sp. FSL W8-0480 TaxID=2954701 RepID=UPI0030D82CD2
MAVQLFNHKPGKNGSHWIELLRSGKAHTILVVAIDIGKYTHKVMMANVYQDVVVKPFELDASLSGFQLLVAKIEETCQKNGLDEVVVGIETTAHYYEDLVRLCHEKGYVVRVINSATTSIERESMLNWSKTDDLDLVAIVHSILQGRGNPPKSLRKELRTLKKLTRFRRELVSQRTRLTNQQFALMDTIFREFQGKTVWVDGKKQKKKPFSTMETKTVQYLMRHHPHPEDILTLGEEGLYELSRKENLKLRKTAVDCLLEFARESISQPKEELAAELYQLKVTLDLLDNLKEKISDLEKKIEELLLPTDGALLLSIPGIGKVLAAELRAEIGPIDDYTHAGQLIKLAGTNPIVKQSGGHKATYGGISKQGRRHFRSVVYLVGSKCSVLNPELRKHYLTLIDRGKKPRQAYIAIGNRVLRLAFAMLRDRQLYQSRDPEYSLKSILECKIGTQENRRQFCEAYVFPS